MDAISDLLDRLTQPLRIDRELQAEVRRELESHLHDTIAENHSAGMTDLEAQTQAIRALGDEKRLCDQLWQANRRRIRLRSWLRWGIGLVALPAAAMIAITALGSVLLSLSWYSGLSILTAGEVPYSRADTHVHRLIDAMSPDDRLLFESQRYGDSRQQRIQNARKALQRWPDDPMLHANLLQAELSAREDIRKHNVYLTDPQSLLQLCDAGQKAEPDNGFYPLIKSAILLTNSCSEVPKDDADASGQIGFVLDEKTKDRYGNPNRVEFSRYTIRDAAKFREGLSLFHEAAGKPYIKDYSMALAKRRLALLGAPRDLNDVLQGTASSISVLLPNLRHIRHAPDVVTSASVYPQLSATVNQPALTDPNTTIHDVYRVGQMVMHDAHTSGSLVQFLVGAGVIEEAMAHAVYQHESAQPGRRAESLRRHYEDFSTLLRQARRTSISNDALTSMGILQKYLTPDYMKVAEAEYRGGRQAEYALLDSAFIGLTMLLLLTLGLLAMAPALALRLAGRSAYVPLLPWRSMSRSIAPSILAAVAVIAALTLLPWTNRKFGLLFTGGIPFVQYLTLLAIILVLLRHFLLRELSSRGLARFAASWKSWLLPGCLLICLGVITSAGALARSGKSLTLAGELAIGVGILLLLAMGLQFIPWPRFAWENRRGSNWLAAASFLVFAVGAALCIYFASSNPNGLLVAGGGIGCTLGAMIVAGLWLCDHLSIARPVGASVTSLAAFGPVSILTALVMGLICLPPLKWQERQGVTAMLAGRTYLTENQVQRSGFNDLAQWLQTHPANFTHSSAQK